MSERWRIWEPLGEVACDDEQVQTVDFSYSTYGSAIGLQVSPEGQALLCIRQQNEDVITATIVYEEF